MTSSDEIREIYLSFFAERAHLRLPSASLVPAAHDPSALLTVAGMHPLKPYFLGHETPPAPRLASCQKVFRTVDIGNVGSTARHLTFFEMLGNFSIGDYFKQEAIRFAWELSLEGFGFDPDRIWITVFEGDDALGLGPDEEAIAGWEAVGVPRERIIECPRSENFWQAGPTGPCGPCSELYLDRGLEFGGPDELPGGEGERFLEYWNLVFMQFDQGPRNELRPLPARNIDTGLGLNRMAAILQGKDTVFETDQFWPLIELGQELSGRRYGVQHGTDRALRILADHARAMTFLIADGVVPSNEDRGYVLRRVMRRAIQQGRVLELEHGFLTRYAAVVAETMGGAYPELIEQHAAIDRWLTSEEQSFGRTLEQGTRLLEELIERAQESGLEGVSAQDAFTLHDTYGFPFELTRELLAERDMGVDVNGFEELMERQRSRARAAAGATSDGADPRQRARAFAEAAGFPTAFTGYSTRRETTTIGAIVPMPATGSSKEPERLLLKLPESPFYPAGGGQISDTGTITCAAGECLARVDEVYRLGEDQALVVTVQRGALARGARVIALVDSAARRATECNHTATHLLHAALRAQLGTHVRQAGSYVGPDKLRFDFSHSQALTAEELRAVEDQVNAWILADDPVRALTTTLDEARRLGAMALFGEKYGDVVRMVEVGVGDYSRELCGGTHVTSTAQIGAFRVLSETSSAANVRRIEALTGPAAIALLRRHDRVLRELAATLRAGPEDVPAVLAERERELRELERAMREARSSSGPDVAALVERAELLDGAAVLTAAVEVEDPSHLLELADRLRGRLPDAAIVLGAALGDSVRLLASVAPSLVARGVKAGAVVQAAAAVVDGGGGGRDTMAQAGGRHPERLDDALAAGRAAIESALSG